MASHLDDGEFARLLYDKIGGLIGPVFTPRSNARLKRQGRQPVGREPMNLFWFAHHTVADGGLTRLPAIPCLSYGEAVDLERQLCEFILRGIGLERGRDRPYLDRDLAAGSRAAGNCRECMT